MVGQVARLACGAQVHAWLVDRRYIRIRCHDRRCQEVRWAKQRGEIAIHVWDIRTGEQWTEYERIDKET